MKTLTLQQANAIVDRAESLFNRAARAWERGNNSGSGEVLRRGEAKCEMLRNQAEALLQPYGIACDYPGLYPSFTVRGRTYYTAEAALSAALEK